MIKSVYVLNERGILLYSKIFEDIKYNENILIGFFTSIVNFSREALKSVVRNIELGDVNKLILYPIPEEKLFTAAIVSSNDNSNLITQILRNLMQNFIHLYSPDYKPEFIEYSKLDEILNKFLKGKVIIKPVLRIFLSIFIILPLSLGLLYLSTLPTEFLFTEFIDKEKLYNINEIYFQILPFTTLITLILIIIIFPITNFISGYIIINYKILITIILIQLAFVNIIYFISTREIFWLSILINLPMVFVISVLFSYIGAKYAQKKKLHRD